MILTIKQIRFGLVVMAFLLAVACFTDGLIYLAEGRYIMASFSALFTLGWTVTAIRYRKVVVSDFGGEE